MPNLKITNDVYEIKCDSNIAIPVTDADYQTFIRQVFAYNVVVNIDELELKQKDENEYDYTYITKDGRTWTQEFIIDDPSNPQMNFTTDFFRLSQFSMARELRSTMIRLLNRFGITKLTFKFN